MRSQGCRQNFQHMGIISSQAGLGESLLKIFKTKRFRTRENLVHNRVFSLPPGYYLHSWIWFLSVSRVKLKFVTLRDGIWMV